MKRFLMMMGLLVMVVGALDAAAETPPVQTPGQPPPSGPAAKKPGPPQTPPTPPRPPEVNAQIAELQAKVTKLQETADVAALLRSIDTHLEKIAVNAPALSQWSTWGSRLDGMASDVKTTSNVMWLVFIVAGVLVSVAIVSHFLQRKDLNRVVDDLHRAVAAATTRPAAPVVVGAVEPNAGPTAGGQAVSLRGRHFASGVAVRFGEVVVPGVTVVSPELIRATTPAQVAGASDVNVQNRDGGADTLRAGYRYVPAPVIAGAYPETSPLAGVRFTIFGANFDQNTRITIGGQEEPTAFGSPNDVNCQLPPHPANFALNGFGVRNLDGQTAQWAGTVTYDGPPPAQPPAPAEI